MSIDEIIAGVNAMLEQYYRFEAPLKAMATVYDRHEKEQDKIRSLADLYLKELTQLDKLRRFLPV